MVKVKTIEEATENWVNHSIQANPDRILGVVRTYLQGRQSLKWVVGLLKGEDGALIEWALKSTGRINPARHEELVNALRK